MEFIIYGLIFSGSMLMVFNIYGFISFALKIKKREKWDKRNAILFIPIALIVLFLIGYLVVGIWGNPDLVMAGILFGGSIFVFIMYLLLDGITKKITENERLEAKLMVTEESARSKSEFLAEMSHEMRTPLNVIVGLDTMALTDQTLSDDTRDRLTKIGLSAKHLLGLINNVLDLNSIESGEFSTKKSEFSLKGMVEQIDAITEMQCFEKGLLYRSEISEGVIGTYLGDETRIKQIILSLLDNAVKFTEKGGVELFVSSGHDEVKGDTLRFKVKDTGVGIDAVFLPKIFDVFSKEEIGSTSRRGGSGLGLALTKKVVELLDGTIIAQSRKGAGSIFTVTIPITRIRKEEAADDGVSLEGRRILIVEDIAENAEIVADLLELEGAESEHAENGRVAVEMFSAAPINHYDAILMDIRMPEMDGITATQNIRALDRADAKSTPIIALSANAFESDIKKSLDAGMNAHLAKPADANLLYGSLKKAISAAINKK